MEIRYFQIIIPLISLLFIAFQIRDYTRRKAGINEVVIVSLFWVAVAVLALFPDFFSELLADALGIKSNINAILFFAIGLLFYLQLRMYKTIKKQDELLTELTRKIALDNEENQ